jgi:hypothetical protein
VVQVDLAVMALHVKIAHKDGSLAPLEVQNVTYAQLANKLFPMLLLLVKIVVPVKPVKTVNRATKDRIEKVMI